MKPIKKSTKPANYAAIKNELEMANLAYTAMATSLLLGEAFERRERKSNWLIKRAVWVKRMVTPVFKLGAALQVWTKHTPSDEEKPPVLFRAGQALMDWAHARATYGQHYVQATAEMANHSMALSDLSINYQKLLQTAAAPEKPKK